MVVSDLEWEEFVNDNVVSVDVIEVIAIRIKIGAKLTEREIAIYKEKPTEIEKQIKNL